MSRTHQVACKGHLTLNFHPLWSREMITAGTTAHPFTRMASASHTLMMLLLVHKCYRGLQINTSQPNKYISWWTTCPGRIQWKICPSIGNIVPRVAGWPGQTLMSVPTASLHRPQPISRQAAVLLLLTTSNDGTAPRTAPETWTFSDAYLTSPMQRESDVLSILLLEEETPVWLSVHERKGF